MTVDAMLLLQPSDVTFFAAYRSRWAGVKRIVIDPGLVEQAASLKVDLNPFEFRSLDVGPHFQARVATEAATRAAALDQALTLHRQDLFGAELFPGWDQSLMRQFFVRVALFTQLGRICDTTFPERRVGLFRPLNPQLFYFDACVTTDAFMGTSRRWSVLEDYPEAANWQPDAFDRCFDVGALRRIVERDAPQAVVHIPTTYRHVATYREQILAAFERFVDLPSPFWDIPIRRDETLTRPVALTAGEPYHDACMAYAERARTTLREHLCGVIPGATSLAAQVELLTRRCLMQALNFHGLRDALRDSRPHFVLTDHDTGSNGPLFSAAAHLDARITVVPHSSYATGAIPHGRRVEVIERAGFRTPMRSVWGEQVACRGVALGPAVPRQPRTRLRTVCMLINGMVSNGLFHIDFLGTIQFHQALTRLCEAHDVRLLLRLKPSAPGLQLFAAALGVAPDALSRIIAPSIEVIAAESDLCVSFGQPTTGTISFLASGCALMHASRIAWPGDPAFSPAYFCDGTVPILAPDEAIARIGRMIESPEQFLAWAGAQYKDFGHRLVGMGGRMFEAA